ncbi:MAG: dehydrogenase E1 component subunit alpha/beta [Cytophagales bacterium]|nr:dehydrogenase E1 component subunit alpha/beta [Cytophagales bacterium]
MNYQKKNYTAPELLRLYELMLATRLFDEKMCLGVKQGLVSKWFSSIGQEAISVGSILALGSQDWALPAHRNLGVYLGRGITYAELLHQLKGTLQSITQGRDRSFHFGSVKHHIYGMISHMAAHLPVAAGIALGNSLDNQGNVTIVYTGEGSTSEGDFHEALNLAAVWQLPIIFMVENNAYALSTPSAEQYHCHAIIDKAPGYGIDGLQIDGNNVLEVYDAVKEISAIIRDRPHPVLIECITFRMRGHEETSGTAYVPEILFDQWAEKDPLNNFENYLLAEKIITPQEIDKMAQNIKSDIEKAIHSITDMEGEVLGADKVLVYKPHTSRAAIEAKGNKQEKKFIEAISETLAYNLEKYPNLILMGQDIADYGGVFKVTNGFVQKYGKERVRNTPLCESAVLGSAIGITIAGYKSVIEMQYADFVSCGFNQIVNHIAKLYYRWGQHVDVVIRMPAGAGLGAGPFHSQSTESWFFHVPGLKMVYPSTAYDAKGLLNAAIDDPNPVLYYEHKGLYRTQKSDVPSAHYSIPIGKANMIKSGEACLIVTYGMGVHWAQQAVAQLNIDISIIDLRSLMPWDKDMVLQEVKRIGKVLLLTEDTHTGSLMAEIAATISEQCFEYLDAPIARVSSLDTPVPFNSTLENQFLGKERLIQKLRELCEY